jgi:hypothetical protein
MWGSRLAHPTVVGSDQVRNQLLEKVWKKQWEELKEQQRLTGHLRLKEQQRLTGHSLG